MAVNGALTADLFAIHFTGTDALGRKFDIALQPEDAKRLLFRLHRIIMDQEKMRLEVEAARDGGRVA